MGKKRPSSDVNGPGVAESSSGRKKVKVMKRSDAKPKKQPKDDVALTRPSASTSESSLQSSFAQRLNFHDDLKFYQTNAGHTVLPQIQQNLNKVFDQYRDQPKTSPDKIGIEGAQRYLTELGVELDEVAHLALCELLQCPSIGEFDREPFVAGWKSLSPRSPSSPTQSMDTVAKQAAYIGTIRKKLVTDPAYFKQVYRNAFKLAKPENQKSVPMDSALEFWKMFFGEGKGGVEWNSTRTRWLDFWLEFYESRNKRPVNKDLWNMVGELVSKVKEPDGEELGWWEEDGAWPMAVDDFVTFIKDKRKEEGESMDTS